MVLATFLKLAQLVVALRSVPQELDIRRLLDNGVSVVFKGFFVIVDRMVALAEPVQDDGHNFFYLSQRRGVVLDCLLDLIVLKLGGREP